MDSFLHALDLIPFVPADLLTVLVLIVLEGLLSCDNAVVLALLVKPLPPELRGRALKYGIIGAYVFRILAILAATWIMSQWYLKVLGGLYLCYMGLSHFMKKKASDEEPEVTHIKTWFGLSPFWSTVMAVELTDIVFSVDSIAAAVALSSKLWVLILGGLLGILAMRFAAGLFVDLLAKFPKLESAAFVAVTIIGFKLLFEFPADIAGQQHVMPAGTTYATSAEYQKAALGVYHPVVDIPHVMTVNRAAAPAPDESIIRAGQTALAASLPEAERAEAIAVGTERELRSARSHWNLHFRPFVEIEGWFSSLIIVIVFACGFIRPKAKA